MTRNPPSQAALPAGGADRPTYEGRPLPRPDQELVDQGLQFDMATLFTRRRLLSLVGVGAGALTLAACGRNSASSISTSGATNASTASTSESTVASDTAWLEIPDETNGPYPADGTNGPDILEVDGIVRSDITSSFGGATGVAEGVPLTFSFTVLDMANGNAPYAGAAVYAWHCDAAGLYSMYSEGVEDENYLRGVQEADADGKVTFTSIVPACYTGRWPHIHFEVYPDLASITDHDKCISTSQAAFPEDVCNEVYNNVDLYAASIRTFANVSIETDGIFDSATIDQQLLEMSGDIEAGFTGSLVVPVDATTEQAVSMSGGGPGAPGGPGGGGSGGPGGPPPGGR